MDIIVGAVLIFGLFGFFSLTFYLNKYKVKGNSNYPVKGYSGTCSSCKQKDCSLHPDYLLGDDNND